MSQPDIFETSGLELIQFCEEIGFQLLTIKKEHIATLETLRRPISAPIHKDSFDRIMLSLAKSEGMIFVTHDSLITYYNEPCITKV